jgi:DNA-binding transcriptional LysR family regulator
MHLQVHRSVQLKVIEGISKDVVQTVRDGGASLGVVWDNTETSDLQHVYYYRDQLVAVMSVKHPLAKREGIRYEELVDHDLVADKHTRHTQAKLQRSGGIHVGDARLMIEVESSHSAIRMAAHGLGIYVCQAKTAQNQGKSLDIAIVPLIEKWADMRIKLVYPSNLLNPIAKRLIEYLSHKHLGISPV